MVYRPFVKPIPEDDTSDESRRKEAGGRSDKIKPATIEEEAEEEIMNLLDSCMHITIRLQKWLHMPIEEIYSIPFEYLKVIYGYAYNEYEKELEFQTKMAEFSAAGKIGGILG